jgi:Trypsin
MTGPDSHRIVLIRSIVNKGKGKENVFGTGYLLTPSLILTARHVVGEGDPESMFARVDHPGRLEENFWVGIEKKVVWKNEDLDSALLRLAQPLSVEVPLPDWGDMKFSGSQVAWESLAYPMAATEQTDAGLKFKTSGLGGTLYVDGGGGQGEKNLDLGVEYEANAWNGISGAPVFVGNRLIGIVKSSFASFTNRRLSATPIYLLLNDPGFLVAITPPWITIPQNTSWVLILNAERANPDLADTTMAAIKRQKQDIERLSNRPLQDQPVIVSLQEALSGPGPFLQFVKAICAAPIMVFDVTDFEPAVMLFLGIRAVARRGITLTTTTKFPQKADLKKLPFNIQETKLIDMSFEEHAIDDAKHPINWIGHAVVKGLFQLQTHLDYLDLPAYDAVRCPPPTDAAGNPQIAYTSLMLCSFDEKYTSKHWKYVSGKIAVTTSPRSVERMLDNASPRLVGLALYESIRWTPCCIVDWSQWSPNVFFEFGVRLACSDIGPVALVEQAEEEPKDLPPLLQRQQLLTLFDPGRYTLDGPMEPFKKAFQRYELTLANKYFPTAGSTLLHNAVYKEIMNSFDWSQEPVSLTPHLDLINSVQALFGKDPQKQGKSQVLYSSNADYARALRTSVQEKYIAAWYYLKGRYTPEEYQQDDAKRSLLIKLGKDAVQWLKNTPEYERILGDITQTIDLLRIRK